MAVSFDNLFDGKGAKGGENNDSEDWTLDEILSNYGADGVMFEKLVARLWERKGYEVTVTERSGDGGVDVVAVDGDRRVVIQAKRYARDTPVSRYEVSDLVGVSVAQRAYYSVFVTTSSYTRAARDFAEAVNASEEKHIELYEGDDLIRSLNLLMR